MTPILWVTAVVTLLFAIAAVVLIWKMSQLLWPIAKVPYGPAANDVKVPVFLYFKDTGYLAFRCTDSINTVTARVRNWGDRGTILVISRQGVVLLCLWITRRSGSLDPHGSSAKSAEDFLLRVAEAISARYPEAAEAMSNAVKYDY